MAHLAPFHAMEHGFSKQMQATAASLSPTSSLRETLLSSEMSMSSSMTAPTMSDWMYWQRDHDCWTKVFVVLHREFLWLLKCQKPGARSVIVQLAVADASSVNGRSLLVTDPNGESVELWLASDHTAPVWLDALLDAAERTREFFGKHPEAAHLESLPRESFYRGTLVEFRRESRRDRCRRYLHKIAECWRQHLHGHDHHHA